MKAYSATHFMKTSSYYPPRAGTASRFLAMTDRLGVRLQLSQLLRPRGYFQSTLPNTPICLLVPGLMWRGQGNTKLGNFLMFAWTAMVLIYVTCLNITWANVAAAIASSLHAISIAAVLAVVRPHWQGIPRILKTMLISMLLVILIYTVGLNRLTPVFAQRITRGDTTFMIHRAGWFSKNPWEQGDWVTYHFRIGGTALDQILACPGDTIRFHPNSFEVNGKHFERVSKHLPKNGEIKMSPGVYLIWPTQIEIVHGAEAQTDFLLRLSQIKQEDISGRPYRNWFWKSFPLAPLKPIPDIAKNTSLNP